MSPMLEHISSKFGEVKLTATLPLPTESGLRLLRAFDQVPPRGATDHDDRTGSSRARYRPISPIRQDALAAERAASIRQSAHRAILGNTFGAFAFIRYDLRRCGEHRFGRARISM